MKVDIMVVEECVRSHKARQDMHMYAQVCEYVYMHVYMCEWVYECLSVQEHVCVSV